jgi:hypothetical protein
LKFDIGLVPTDATDPQYEHKANPIPNCTYNPQYVQAALLKKGSKKLGQQGCIRIDEAALLKKFRHFLSSYMEYKPLLDLQHHGLLFPDCGKQLRTLVPQSSLAPLPGLGAKPQAPLPQEIREWFAARDRRK